MGARALGGAGLQLLCLRGLDRIRGPRSRKAYAHREELRSAQYGVVPCSGGAYGPQ